MHPLLARQLRKAGLAERDLDDGLDRLLSLVGSAYEELDQERRRNDRAMRLMSEELTALNERIRRQANHDPLTGLPNRTLFMDRLHTAISLAERTGQMVALMFVDLDGFKLVNDTFGHGDGDHLLQQAALRLQSCLRPGDTVARLGGDEFTVLMTAVEAFEQASLVAEQIIAALEKPFTFGGNEASVSVSLGIATFPDDADNPHLLLKAADAAMSRAKEQSRGGYEFYTPGMNREAHERLTLRNCIARALERGEFHLAYQPKVALRDGRVTGVEALLRWNSTDLGMVPPVSFIPVMEECGLIVSVGEWVIDEACRQARSWREGGLRGIRVAVNLSVRQLRHADLPRMIGRILKKYDLPPQALELEITESMVIKDTERTASVLGELHAMGLAIAMDDFGTGYSSLNYLRRLPIDTIKIDQCFVRDIEARFEDMEIIRAAISMGRALHRRIVAEGVETEAQMNILRHLDCDEVQGYAICRPMPAAEVTPVLRRLSTQSCPVVAATAVG